MEKLLQGVRREPVSPEAFEAVADHLMGLGYAGLAARWRSWALLPPEASQREAAVADLEWHLAADGRETAPPPPPPADAPQDPELLLQRIHDLLERGAAAEARRLLTGLALGTGLPPRLCHQAGQLAREAGEPAEAERWFRTGLQKDPAKPLPWFALARVLLDLEAWDEALASAEQGLQLAPGQAWGQKLRLQALDRSGAGRSLTRLAERGGLPDLPALQAKLEGLAQRQRRHAQRRWPQPPPLPLGQRMELHRRLADRSPFWVVLHGRGAGPLALAHQADLLPPGLRVQPLASRDPIGLQDALAPLPLELLAERPARILPRLPTPGLAVLHRNARAALPLLLHSLLLRDVPLLAPIGLLTPAALDQGRGRHRLLRHGGWELLWPLEAAAP